MMKPAVMFACGQNVMMPSVGADDRVLTPRVMTTKHPEVTTRKQSSGVNRSYVKKISADILFSEDVVRERGFHTLPYKSSLLDEVLDFSDIISPSPKSILTPGGRYNNRISRVNHMPCHLEKRGVHKLKPIKRKILDKAAEMQQQTQQAGRREQESESIADDALPDKEEGDEEDVEVMSSLSVSPRNKSSQIKVKSGQSSEVSSEMSEEYVTPPKLQHEWDEYLLSILSVNTAQWIVTQSVPAGPHSDRLTNLLLEQHGQLAEEAELIPDNVSESGEQALSREPTSTGDKKWKKGDGTLLERIREAELLASKQTDPYGDNTEASFYRLPAGVRRSKKHQDKEEAGAINSTAFNIHVPVREETPPPTIRDFINPKAGDKLYETTNAFQQERLTGVQQVYDKDGDATNITMENNNKYIKVLQAQSPRPPDTWFPSPDNELLQPLQRTGKTKPAKLDKGLQRWKQLPQPLQDSCQAMLVSQNGHDSESTQRAPTEPEAMALVRKNTSLTKIVQDWRAKWHLDSRYADASPDDLIRDMADIHPHIRLKAIATCSRAAEYRPPPEMGIQIDTPTQQDTTPALPEKLFIGLECLLEDPREQIQRAAAITLYTLERPSPMAEQILRETLQNDKSVDRWAAAQCLAHFGVCDSDVVGELVHQLLNSEEVIRHEQAIRMLTKLSINSTLPHSMLAEQLNSSSWRHKVLVCKALPKLHGTINKDLMNKLSNLLWYDWHSEVRKASAQALGRTGHGKTVHNQLREKMLNGIERERVEAIAKIGHLGIMTAKLLPAYLQCFDDEYVSVRKETCITAGNLKIQEKEVIDKLLHLATHDPIWKVKALAIQALGKIGCESLRIRNCLLWALRYEDQAGVRAEAVHAVHQMALQDSSVIQILQDRFLVETSDIVKMEITDALGEFNINPTDDMETVNQIKEEVRKLCTRENICVQITKNEDVEEQDSNMKRLIYQPPPVKKEDVAGVSGTMKSVRSSTPATRGMTPERVSVAPLSREETMCTPTADHEVQDIITRSERVGRLTPETTMSSRSQTRSMTATTGTDSNTYKTSYTATAPGTPGSTTSRRSHVLSRVSTNVADDSSKSTTTSHDMSGLSRYRQDTWDEGIDLSDPANPMPTSETPTNQTTPSVAKQPPAKQSNLQVMQTYVEVVAEEADSSGQQQDMENVIQIKYESPDLQVRKDPPADADQNTENVKCDSEITEKMKPNTESSDAIEEEFTTEAHGGLSCDLQTEDNQQMPKTNVQNDLII